MISEHSEEHSVHAPSVGEPVNGLGSSTYLAKDSLDAVGHLHHSSVLIRQTQE